MEVLRDNYSTGNSNYDDFKKENLRFASMTEDVIVRGCDITFLSVCTAPAYQKDGFYTFYVLNNDYVSGFLNNGARLAIGRIKTTSIPDELMHELMGSTGMMAIIGEEKYLVSSYAIPTLTLRTGVSGDTTISRQNLIRNMHLADAVFSKNERIHIVYRDINGTKKIFAFLGSAYKLVPQTIVTEIADKVSAEAVLGKTETKGWRIDHEFTDLSLSFPEAADDFATMYTLPTKITPGLSISTSDIGANSVTVRSVYSCDNSEIYTGEVSIRHSGSVTVAEIMNAVNDTIFTDIRRLPETLMSLLAINVTPVSADLATEDGQCSNHDTIVSLYKKILKKEFKKVLGAKKQTSLLEALSLEINSGIIYTAYDIASTFIGLPARMEGVDSYSLTEIKKICAKVPFVLADMYGVSSAKTEPSVTEDADDVDIVLLPA